MSVSSGRCLLELSSRSIVNVYVEGGGFWRSWKRALGLVGEVAGLKDKMQREAAVDLWTALAYAPKDVKRMKVAEEQSKTETDGAETRLRRSTGIKKQTQVREAT